MSYTFEFSLPDVQEGSEEAAKEKAKFRAVSSLLPALWSQHPMLTYNPFKDGEESSRELYRHY
jgi:hypothetical protein